MLLKMISLAMIELKKSLYEKFITWRKYEEAIEKMYDNFEIMKLSSLLIQAGLFSEEGITMMELQHNMQASQYIIKKLMGELPEGMLVIKVKNKFKFYSANLNRLNTLILSESMGEILKGN